MWYLFKKNRHASIGNYIASYEDRHEESPVAVYSGQTKDIYICNYHEEDPEKLTNLINHEEMHKILDKEFSWETSCAMHNINWINKI